MGKYDPLFEHLCRRGDGVVELSFAEIESLAGTLPASAHKLRQWWGNEVSGTHVQAAAWLNAGREVEAVDLERQTVRFGRAGWRRGS